MATILTLHPDRQAPSLPPRARAGAPSLTPEVYRRRRLAVAALVLGLVLGAMSLGRQADASRTPDAEAADSITYVVRPGDTLWDIARDLSPGADPRSLVAALDEIAEGPMLQPGQRIVVPGHLVD